MSSSIAFGERVGLLGLGTMGLPMARNLHASIGDLVVWNRSDGPLEKVRSAGMTVVDSASEVFDTCPIVMTMLASEAALDAVLGRDAGIDVAIEGRLLVNLATTTPGYSAALAADISDRGGAYVECPVSGSKVPAAEARLVAMIAGADADIERVVPLIETMCSGVVRCGQVPDASAMKLSNNVFLIATMNGLVEAFEFGRRLGIDLDILARVIGNGPIASDIAAMKIPKILAGDHAPQASVAAVSEVARMILEVGHREGVTTPVLAACAQLYDIARDLSLEADDMTALAAVYAQDQSG